MIARDIMFTDFTRLASDVDARQTSISSVDIDLRCYKQNADKLRRLQAGLDKEVSGRWR